MGSIKFCSDGPSVPPVSTIMCQRDTIVYQSQGVEYNDNGELLDNSVFPLDYEFYLRASLNYGTYSGTVRIRFRVDYSSSSYRLHCANVKLLTFWLAMDYPQQANIPIRNILFDEQHEMIIIVPKFILRPEYYLMYITFEGKINRDYMGLYVDTYNDEYGKSQEFIVAQFEPTFARFFCPCFDDPSYQATFQLNIVNPMTDDLIVLSNANAEKTTLDYPQEGLSTIHFKRSEAMPIHQLAFVIGKFSSALSTPTPGGLYIAIYARNDLVMQTIALREMANEIAQAAERLFCQKFVFPKIVILAIPKLIVASKESGELIVMKEKYVLDLESVPAWNYLKSMSLIAYDIARLLLQSHVKLKYWNDFWLKEGLAGFIGNMLTENFHRDSPDWLLLSLYTFPMMKRDGYKCSYTIYDKFCNSVRISNIYKAMIFKKSVAIINMIFSKERKILRSILYQYFTNEKILTLPLFTQLVANMLSYNPESVFETFTKQTGYPILNVTSLSNGEHFIEQSSFVNNKYFQKNTAESEFGFKWTIPINYIFQSEPQQNKLILMNKNEEKISVNSNPGDWILLNYKQAGYYRVNYSRQAWTNFAYLMMKTPEILSSEDRAGLIENAFSLTNAGYFHYNIPFNLTVYLYFHKEPNYFIWRVISKNLYEIAQHLIGTESYPKFKSYIRTLLQGSYDINVWYIQESDHYVHKLTKYEILNLGGWSSDPRIMRIVKEHFLDWLEESEAYQPEILNILLKYGLYDEENRDLWDKVYRKYTTTVNQETKDSLWFSLANVNDSDLLFELLRAENPVEMDEPDIIQKKIKPLLENNYAIPALWDFMKTHAEYFFSQPKIVNQIFFKYFVRLTSKFDTPRRLKEVNVFVRNLTDYSKIPSIEVSIESIKNNVNWKAAYYEILTIWLDQYLSNFNEDLVEEMAGEFDEGINFD